MKVTSINSATIKYLDTVNLCVCVCVPADLLQQRGHVLAAGLCDSDVAWCRSEEQPPPPRSCWSSEHHTLRRNLAESDRAPRPCVSSTIHPRNRLQLLLLLAYCVCWTSAAALTARTVSALFPAQPPQSGSETGFFSFLYYFIKTQVVLWHFS